MAHLKLKVCGLREAANIAAVAALAPDYIGFIFVPSSPRYIGDTPPAITPPSIKRIGVFRDTPLSTVNERAAFFNLHGVQLHGEENHEYMQALKDLCPDLTIIKAISVTSAEDLAAIKATNTLPDIYLFDNGSGGSGESFNWSWLSSYKARIPFLLAGGIGLHNIDLALKAGKTNPSLLGIDINSHVEVSPGIKNIDQIREITARIGT